jgi:hypothetical protein
VQNPSSSSFRIQKYKDYDKKHYILPAVLYGSESRSLAFIEEHRLRVFQNVFQNRVLRRVFGLRYEVTRVKKTT